MALEIESVNPPSAIHLNDGDEKSMMAADLEDGEIEDDEIPEEEAGGINERVVGKKAFSAPSLNAPVKQTEVKIKPSTLLTKVGTVSDKHVDSRKENIVEDDWVNDVEKAIKAALGSKGKTADSKTVTFMPDAKCQIDHEDDGERKSRKKKRKKKHRDDDEDRKEMKKRKRSHGISKETSETVQDSDLDLDDDDNDDDEMLFIRGASPIMRMGYSSPSHIFHNELYEFEEGRDFEDLYDNFSDDSNFELEDYTRPRRGDDSGPKRGGRGMRRRLSGRGGGRGLVNKRLQGHRKEALVNKGKRIGLKRQQQRSSLMMQESRQGADSICMFFMQRKCQKGDDCPYSHDAHPPRKMELCKFYLMDCCAKKDKCLYMHSDFPCKFYHTGLKCFAGDRCKFSHGTLTEPLRAILLKHLETAPKEILGDFPRLSREGAAAMVYSKKNRGNKGSGPGNKKIPSLFEIEVPIPAQLLSGNLHADEEKSPARRSTPMPDSENEDQDACSTPMPSPPKVESRNTSSRSSNRQWDAENCARPGDNEKPYSRFSSSHHGTDSFREHSEERVQTKRTSPDYQNQDFSQQLQQLKMRFYQDTVNTTEDSGVGSESRHRRHRHQHHGKSKTSNVEQERKNKGNLHRLTKYSPSHAVDSGECGGPSKESSKQRSGEALQYADEEIDDQKSEFQAEVIRHGTPPEPSASGQEVTRKEQLENDNNSSCSTDMGGIPHNLPKKQRELFLRIQQQQREAIDSSSQEHSGEDEGKDVGVDKVQQEENWYSSDEEGASLADVLKNLYKQSQQEQSSKQEPRLSTPPLLPTSLDSIKLADIDISESVSKLLSSIRNQQNAGVINKSPGAEISELRTYTVTASPVQSQARDPRLVSRDPRNRGSSTSSTSVMSSHNYEDPQHDPHTLKRSGSSDEKRESPRTSIYISAITISSSNETQSCSDSGSDVDFRRFHTKQQHVNTSFETRTDMDLRQNMLMGSSYMYGDTDLRADIDLRGMLGLPFKPVPMHTPATEIDASLTSHPPIPYKVVTITIPRPDYSGLKLNMSDPQVRSDPRLRKLFKTSNSTNSPASPPPLPPPPPKRSPSSVSRSDPRRRSAFITTSTSSSRVQDAPPVYTDVIPQNFMNMPVMHAQSIPPGIIPSLPPAIPLDPRHPRNLRNAPGLLGHAPLSHNYCPSTPRYEEMEESNSNGSDTDFRMFYNQSPMDLQPQNLQNQQQARNRAWQNNRHDQRYQSQHVQQRSFTPPL